MLLNNNLYKIIYIYTILIFWKCPYSRVRGIAASRLTKNSPPDCFCLYEAVPYLPNATSNCWNLILGGFYHITASFAVFCKAKMEALRPKQNSVSKH